MKEAIAGDGKPRVAKGGEQGPITMPFSFSAINRNTYCVDSCRLFMTTPEHDAAVAKAVFAVLNSVAALNPANGS